MNHSNSSSWPRRLKAAARLAAFASAALLGAGLLAPQAALADHDDHRGDRGRHEGYRHEDHGRRGDDRHDDRRYRRDYWGRPEVVYAPPPVIYRPEPSVGISLFFPIEIH